MTAVGRKTTVQRLVGGDIIVRSLRPATVTESMLKKNIEVLKRGVKAGRLEVRTITGNPVDLDSLQVIDVPKVTKPLPNFPQDSVARDKQNVGEYMPPYADGKAVDQVAVSPTLTKDFEEAPLVGVNDPVEERKKARRGRKKDEESTEPKDDE